MSGRSLVLYHAHCADGFAAALVAWEYFQARAGTEAEVEFRAVSYGEPAPEIPMSIERVFLLDFSYPREVLRDMVAYHPVVVLDHHQTAEAALAGFEEEHEARREQAGFQWPLRIRFEREKSGAVMAWEYFRDEMPGSPIFGPVPELLRYIDDRDRWKWELPQSREVSAALAAEPRSFKRWSALLWDEKEWPDTELAGLKMRGEIILRMRRSMVEDICGKSALMTIGSLQAPAVNTPVLQSEVCERLLELHPNFAMAACYWDDVSGSDVILRRWSLRSRPGFDCSVVAKIFGGGGHAQAAGFEQRIEPGKREWTAPASQHDIGCGVFFSAECDCCYPRAGRLTTKDATDATKGTTEGAETGARDAASSGRKNATRLQAIEQELVRRSELQKEIEADATPGGAPSLQA